MQKCAFSLTYDSLCSVWYVNQPSPVMTQWTKQEKLSGYSSGLWKMSGKSHLQKQNLSAC